MARHKVAGLGRLGSGLTRCCACSSKPSGNRMPYSHAASRIVSFTADPAVQVPLRSCGPSAATACERSGCHPEGDPHSGWKRSPANPVQRSPAAALPDLGLLISEAVLNWSRVEDRVALARMFEHSHLRSVCASKRDELNKEFKDKKTDRPNQAEAVKRNLHRVVSTFVQMHEQRELADYDYGPTGPAPTFSSSLRALPPRSKPERSGMRM